MGKLTIEGNAKRVCHCDVMKITVDFRTRETSTTEALEKVMNQCEEFLSVLDENGVDIENIVLGDTSVDARYYDEGEKNFYASREINIYSAFDMKFLNFIMSFIKNKNFNADVDCDYGISNINVIHKELLKEAVLDSKTKAEATAESVGEKITGIDTIKGPNRDDDEEIHMLAEGVHKISAGPSYKLSDKLKSPVSTEEEKVTVTWIVE